MSLFPILLVTHVALALALFVPSVLLPFLLNGEPEPTGRVTRALLGFQGRGSLLIGIGVGVTGLLLVLSLGSSLQPWLLTALGLYALALAIAFFIQQPNVRRFLRLAATSQDHDRRSWRRRAAPLRYVSYAMGLIVGVIGWLMASKPAL